VSMQEQSTADSQQMIAALQLSLDLRREELQAARATAETMTWVSIGVGAVALTSTLLWVTK
jgi:predicted transcriptional regulator